MSFIAEYQRRLRHVLSEKSGKEVDSDREVKVSEDTRLGGYCDTCRYQFDVLILSNGVVSVEIEDIGMGELMRMLEAVPEASQ